MSNKDYGKVENSTLRQTRVNITTTSANSANQTITNNQIGFCQLLLLTEAENKPLVVFKCKCLTLQKKQKSV